MTLQKTHQDTHAPARHGRRTAAIALLLLLGTGVQAQTRILDFDVLLDGKPMGSHRYTLATAGERVKVTSEADYAVKVLFVTAWRYRHRSVETWVRGCLRSIESATDENGQAFHVNGKTTAAGLELDTHDGPKQYPGCVRTFAYWNPDLQRADALMNAQTGKVEPVTITALTPRPAPGQGSVVDGAVLGIRGKDIHIDVWQDQAGNWFGLSSRTPEGRVVEYVMRADPEAPASAR